MKITSADFVKSARAREEYPREGLPEVAFAGRSNVGKSSLINALTRRKNLARTSSTPGRTRSINFMRVNGKYMFADLPGFGFAQVSIKERMRWKKMVEEYLATRQELRAVVIITDLRRAPGEEERELIGFITAAGREPILVATKADKLGKTKRKKPLQETARALGVSPESIIVCSSRTREGMDELWKRLKKCLEQ